MEIKIGKSARVCQSCERLFEHEEAITSLVRVENRVLVREDYCAQCWASERATGAYSIWSPRFYDPKVAEQQPPEVFSPLRQAFYEAAESEDRGQLATAYLAAQLLRRQKVFRLIKEAEDHESDGRIALYEDRIANRLIEVRDPSLSYAEMEAGRARLLERLSELENPQEDLENAERPAPVEASAEPAAESVTNA